MSELGCSQAVRQRFLVACTAGSNPATPAIGLIDFLGFAKLNFFVVYTTVYVEGSGVITTL